MRCASACVAVLAALFAAGSGRADEPISQSRVKQGFAASPIPKSQLNFDGKDPAQVGLGSYLVNGAADCNGCHSFPRFLPQGNTAGSNPGAGDPYQRGPWAQSDSRQLRANFNTLHFLAGGRCFGPYMSYNLTPDRSGRPLGLTREEFLTALRKGTDVRCVKHPSDPICATGPNTRVLQTMSWPTYHSMTDGDLGAIYAYLGAIPPAHPCNTPAHGCPGYSGLAANSTTYVYPDTADCPNPAPPQ